MGLNKHICTWFSSLKLSLFPVSALISYPDLPRPREIVKQSEIWVRDYISTTSQFVECRLFFYSGSLNVWFRLTKCRLTRFRRPHIPMISFVCLCVFMWKDGYVWSYGWTATRMGIGNEFANPEFPNCLSRFWYFAELVNCLFVLDLQSNRPHPSLFGSSSACTY